MAYTYTKFIWEYSSLTSKAYLANDKCIKSRLYTIGYYRPYMKNHLLSPSLSVKIVATRGFTSNIRRPMSIMPHIIMWALQPQVGVGLWQKCSATKKMPNMMNCLDDKMVGDYYYRKFSFPFPLTIAVLARAWSAVISLGARIQVAANQNSIRK